jgi:hypothetical protein
MTKRKTHKKTGEPNLRETYLLNQSRTQADFRACLEEACKDKPSVPGIVAGMDFQQFSARQVFFYIVEQEKYIEYAKKYSLPYVDLKEERETLKDMVKRAKKVFGKQYDSWYADAQEDEAM